MGDRCQIEFCWNPFLMNTIIVIITVLVISRLLDQAEDGKFLNILNKV